jgi:hypothetical protein
MATTSEIADVRLNVDEETDQTWDDDAIGLLVDADGVNGTSAIIWRQKAARWAKLVDVSEAGSSHAFSDLHAKAIAMAEKFDALSAAEGGVDGTLGRAKVKVIDREYTR